MITHFIRIAGIILLIVLCIVYPFLPGGYDSLAMPLSTMAQAFGVLGLLLIPVGLWWLVYEVRKQVRRRQNLPVKGQRYYFALVSVIVASAFAVLIIQVVLAAPLTEHSRNRAIANSDEFIRDIEAYHDEYDHYPVSLTAMWKDYYPDVIGVEKFHYSPYDESYNLFFEQPRFFLDNLGTREWVVYNPNDEQRMYSHTAWFLLLTPEELERSQGWYSVHDASTLPWKYFWFD